MLPVLALGGEFPPATVRIRDRLFALMLLLQCELRAQLATEPVRNGVERSVGGTKPLVEDRFILRENGIEVRILCDCPQHNVRNRSVPESLRHARRFVSK